MLFNFPLNTKPLCFLQIHVTWTVQHLIQFISGVFISHTQLLQSVLYFTCSSYSLALALSLYKHRNTTTNNSDTFFENNCDYIHDFAGSHLTLSWYIPYSRTAMYLLQSPRYSHLYIDHKRDLSQTHGTIRGINMSVKTFITMSDIS